MFVIFDGFARKCIKMSHKLSDFTVELHPPRFEFFTSRHRTIDAII